MQRANSILIRIRQFSEKRFGYGFEFAISLKQDSDSGTVFFPQYSGDQISVPSNNQIRNTEDKHQGTWKQQVKKIVIK